MATGLGTRSRCFLSSAFGDPTYYPSVISVRSPPISISRRSSLRLTIIRASRYPKGPPALVHDSESDCSRKEAGEPKFGGHRVFPAPAQNARRHQRTCRS
jgi:hypothetical protein